MTVRSVVPAETESTTGRYSLGEAKKWLREILALTDLTPMIHGAPGIGKSSIVAQIAEEDGYDLITCSLLLFDPTEMKGIPTVDTVPANGNGCGYKKTTWAVPNRWPSPAVQYCGDRPEIELELNDSTGKPVTLHFYRKEAEDGWDEIEDRHLYRQLQPRPDFRCRKGILFLDEFNAAPSLVQCVTLKLVDNRCIETYELPDEWRIACAGNLGSEDQTLTSRTSSAVNNRFVHFFVAPCSEEWDRWAKENRLHPGVRSFLRVFPQFLSKIPERGEVTFATPRSWANLSRFMSARETRGDRTGDGGGRLSDRERMLDLIELVRRCGASFVGAGPAMQLAAFLELQQQVDVEAVLNGEEEPLQQTLEELPRLGADRLHGLVSACLGYVQAMEQRGRARPAHYRNLCRVLTALPRELRVAALSVLDDELLDRIEQHDPDLYDSVLAEVTTGISLATG